MEGKQAALFVLMIVLLILSFISVLLRCLARVSIRAFGIDDWLMIAAWILFFGSTVPMFYATLAAIGVKEEHITAHDATVGIHGYFAWEPFYVWTLVFTKASICFTFLRIAESKILIRIIYAIMGLSTACGLITFVAIFNYCHPLSQAWDPKDTGHCKDGSYVVDLAYFISATSIITDFTCAVLPVFILWKVQIEARLKVTLVFILGMGFLASSATLVRLRYLAVYTTKVEYFYKVSDIVIWSMVECALGIMAGSASTLKPLVRRMVSKFGSSKGYSTNAPKNQYNLRDLTMPSVSNYNTTKITTNRRNVDHDDSDSQKDMITNNGIMVATEVDLEEEFERGSRISKKHPTVFEEEV